MCELLQWPWISSSLWLDACSCLSSPSWMLPHPLEGCWVQHVPRRTLPGLPGCSLLAGQLAPPLLLLGALRPGWLCLALGGLVLWAALASVFLSTVLWELEPSVWLARPVPRRLPVRPPRVGVLCHEPRSGTTRLRSSLDRTCSPPRGWTMRPRNPFTIRRAVPEMDWV